MSSSYREGSGGLLPLPGARIHALGNAGSSPMLGSMMIWMGTIFVLMGLSFVLDGRIPEEAMPFIAPPFVIAGLIGSVVYYRRSMLGGQGRLHLAMLVIACGEPVATDAGMHVPMLDAPGLDGGEIDSDAGTVDAGRDAPSADAPPLSCDEAIRPDLGTAVQNNRGLVVARDGTIYFSQPGAVGRRTPDGTLSVGWLSIPGRLVASVALDASNDVLFVGVPDYDETGAPSVYRVDVATMAITPIANGGNVFGIAVGPDGNVYFTAPADHVSRVAPSGGTITQVTTIPVLSPSSLAFESDGSLLVGASYMGQVLRLTLVDGVEAARAMVAIFPSVHGLALDAEGRIYGASNGGGFVGRMAADGTGLESIVMDASAPFGLAFGHGALCGSDLFVNSGGLIRRFENDTPGAAVLWH